MDTADRLVDLVLADPPGTALFSDFDGTLSPIVADPAAARPAPGAVDALVALARHLHRVAVLSGRPLAYLDPLVPPAIDVGALYGLERRVAGRAGAHPDAERWRPIVERLAADAMATFERIRGVTVEPKGLSLTLHFRNAPDAGPEVSAWAAAAAAKSGVRVGAAKASVELHPPIEVSKGTQLVEWAGGARAAVFLGDDLGDLPAFAALRAEVEAGRLQRSLAVVVVGDETAPAVRAAADLTLPGPAALVAALQRVAAALG